jgi:hypothetical protein
LDCLTMFYVDSQIYHARMQPRGQLKEWVVREINDY